MSTLINGKIKEWTKLTSGGLNCELENGKITFWSAEKAVLQQTYPKGSIVEIVHDHGTGKVMRPFGDQSEKPTPPPPATAPAPAKTKAVEPEKKTGTVKSVGNKAIPPEETAKRAEDAGFKTGTEVKNAEESEVVKRADENKKAQSDQRMKDNEEHARQLATDRSAAQAVTSRIPPLTQTPTQTSSSAVSTKVQEPVGQRVDPAQKTAESPILPSQEGSVMGAVSLKIHINLGSFCNFDLGVEGATGDHARLLLKQEAEKSISLVANIMREAVKVSQTVRIQ